uniref:Uncharacterized protein n=1 Tax=Caenorhabditis japonica TaxID=281687 RepID=A0A8R1IPP2_CAEJA
MERVNGEDIWQDREIRFDVDHKNNASNKLATHLARRLDASNQHHNRMELYHGSANEDVDFGECQAWLSH